MVGRETRNIGLSFDLSSTLARICNREISRDSRRAIFLSFGKSRETTYTDIDIVVKIPLEESFSFA